MQHYAPMALLRAACVVLAQDKVPFRRCPDILRRREVNSIPFAMTAACSIALPTHSMVLSSGVARRRCLSVMSRIINTLDGFGRCESGDRLRVRSHCD